LNNSGWRAGENGGLVELLLLCHGEVGACVRKPRHYFAITDGPLGYTAVDSEQFMPQGWFATRGIVGELGRL
jgi:hypothetical protein